MQESDEDMQGMYVSVSVSVWTVYDIPVMASRAIVSTNSENDKPCSVT